MDVEKIIFNELNDFLYRIEDQSGNKLNVIDDTDFKEIILNIVKKLAITKATEKKKRLRIIRSVELYLSAHPDNESNSECADRIEDMATLFNSITTDKYFFKK